VPATQFPTGAGRARWLVAVVLLAAACSVPGPTASMDAAPAGLVPAGAASLTASPRPLPLVLFGVTADDVSPLGQLVAGARHLARVPVTRLYFDAALGPSAYAAAVRALRPVSYLMGELLDSSDAASMSTAAYARRVSAYLSALGSQVDIWEVGNEVNGNWAGPYPAVAAKLTAGYRLVAARHLRSALTLYYNVGCGDGPGELDPLAFSRRYVPAAVRDGLGYVFLSYYEDQCGGRRPAVGTWTSYFKALHALYPRARLGFGEVGLSVPATAATAAAAEALIRHYYGLRVRLPYYAGGYFWWYYAEDCLPYRTRPLWQAVNAGFTAEARVLGG
jgi:hypothetical protein